MLSEPFSLFLFKRQMIKIRVLLGNADLNEPAKEDGLIAGKKLHLAKKNTLRD